MDVREKLVELLDIIIQPGQKTLGDIADYLIRNGVTVQGQIVDAVEVVRCRDCKYRGTDYCISHIKGEPADEELLRKLDNDFCSYGERKGGDGNVKA